MRDHFNELNLTLKDGDRTFGVVARAYDDGVGLRMVLPKQPGMDSFVVTREATEFTFADDDQVWAGWNNPEGTTRPEGGFIGSQEWRYLPNKLSALNPAFKHGLPFLVRTRPAYVAITESDLLDWSGMWLVHQGRRKEHARGATRSADTGAAMAGAQAPAACGRGECPGAGQARFRRAWLWARLPTIPPGGRSSSAASLPTSFRATWC